MRISIHESKNDVGKQAARKGARMINEAIQERGKANIIVATGSSQFEMLDELVTLNIDWTKVTAFHLDEYIGIPLTHPASFRKYLKERFVDKVPLKAFHYINGEVDSQEECERLGKLIGQQDIDVAFVGIGENAHLAFNDPPADFETEAPYIVVELDDACRQQQLGEGWFSSLEEVMAYGIGLGKGLIFGVLSRVFGYINIVPVAVGLGLFQVGEFSFVLARLGIESNAQSYYR